MNKIKSFALKTSLTAIIIALEGLGLAYWDSSDASTLEHIFGVTVFVGLSLPGLVVDLGIQQLTDNKAIQYSINGLLAVAAPIGVNIAMSDYKSTMKDITEFVAVAWITLCAMLVNSTITKFIWDLDFSDDDVSSLQQLMDDVLIVEV